MKFSHKLLMIIAVTTSFLPAIAFAEEAGIIGGDLNASIYDQFQNTGQQTYEPGGALQILDVAGAVVRVAMGVLGTVGVILVIWAGFIWMTAGGNDQSIQKSKNIIKAVVIGTIILGSAYALTTFVFRQFGTAEKKTDAKTSLIDVSTFDYSLKI